MSKSKTRERKILPIIFIITVIPIALMGLIIFSFKGKIFPNTFIAGIYVGDKTKAEAVRILEDQVKISDYINLSAGEKDFRLQTNQIKLSYDFQKSVDRAYYLSNSGNFLKDIQQKVFLMISPKNLGLDVNYDENELDEVLSIISSEIGTPAVYPSVELSNNEIVINKGTNGIEVDLIKTKEDLLQKISTQDGTKIDIYFKNLDVELSPEDESNIRNRAQKLISQSIALTFEDSTLEIPKKTVLTFLNYGDSYDEKQIKNYVAEVSKDFNRPAQNSTFVVVDGKVQEFTPSKDGVSVNEESLTNNLIGGLKSLEQNPENKIIINVPANISPAKIKNEDVNNLGINTLIGKGVSYFRGSIPNRVYNINHAASKFKGILVAPGETFSFDQVLGDVSALTGYKSAYVIKDGKTVLGDGGGVCQVSTTMFRAALDAGLPITERRAHSYRVGYYEQGFPVGLDATVYYPTTDLKFVNNTPAHILIQSEIDIPHSTLVFEIYGTDDGRVAITSKPVITSSTAPPEDLYIDDPTLPAGTVKQIDYKAWGAKVRFDYKVTRGNETLTEKTFYSNYQPWQAVFLRGIGSVN